MVGKREFYGFCIAIIGLCMLASCKVERPETVFSNERMEAVLLDYHLARAMGEELSYDDRYKRELYLEAVFKKHGITEAEFDSSMVWFARHPEVMAGIYENIRGKLKNQRDYINNLIAERDNKPRLSLPGDSVNVWFWQNFYQLTGSPLDNKVTFVLSPDTNFQDRDTLRWNVRFRFMESGRVDTAYAPVMALQVRYKHDSIVSAARKILADTLGTVMLAADTLGKMEEIRGFIYYPQQSVPRILSLDQISLMRYRSTDSLSVDTVSQSQPVAEKAEVKKIPSATNVGDKSSPVQSVELKEPASRQPIRKIDKSLSLPQQQ